MPLTPFPLNPANGGVFVDDDLTAWASNGWVITGDAIMIDGWQSDADQIEMFSQHAAYWGSNPANEQSPATRSTYVTKTYSGLPANRYVVVTVGVAFYSQSFGAVGKFIGMQVNGVNFAPNVASSETITPNLGQIVGTGVTDESGAITVAFAAIGMGPPSFDLHIIFDSLTISTPEAELASIFYDAGVLYISGNPISISRGGITFEPNEEFAPFDIPGVIQPLVGMEELVSSRPVLRTTLMLTGEYQFTVYRPDGTWGDHASVSGARTYTPNALRSALSTGVYLQSVIAVWPRARGDYIAVEFPFAVCRKYGVGSKDKDEGEIPVEIEARIPITDSAGDSTYTGAIFDGASPGYLIHTFAAGTEW